MRANGFSEPDTVALHSPADRLDKLRHACRALPGAAVYPISLRLTRVGTLEIYRKADRLRELGVFSKNDILTRAEAEEMLQDRLNEGHEPIILYKMHGSAVSYVPRNARDESLSGGLNSIVLTEQDYIDFLDKNTMQRLPIQVK